MNFRYQRWLAVPLVAASIGCGSASSEDVSKNVEEIINGDLPSSQGALAGWGVVNLGGCTGTLVANQYVLTAHHCARDSNGLTNRQAELEVPGGSVFANTAVTHESSTSVILNAPDFALLELDAPLAVGDDDDAHYNPIYSGSDSSLLNQSVFCMGVGGTVEATSTSYASGFGTLTSATIAITSASGGVLGRALNGSGQVGFGGDSGSSCFLNGAITGIQSTCAYSTHYDLNGNGKNDSWYERAGTYECFDSAPSNFRTFVNNIVRADLSLSATFVPTLPSGTSVTAVVSTPIAQNQTKTITSGWSGTDYALRSGYVTVRVNEPVGMMCPAKTKKRTPLTGNVAFDTTCLGDGLVSVLL